MDFLHLYIMIISAVTFGYLLAAVFVETKLINYFGIKTLGLSKFGIHPLLTTMPVLYLVSPRAAHVHASELLRQGKIKPVDLYLAILASNLPMRLMFLYRYYLPVLFPLIGIVAIYYALLRIFFDTLVFIAVSFVGRIRYRGTDIDFSKFEAIKVSIGFSEIRKALYKGLLESLKFTLKFTPIFLVVVFLIDRNLMTVLTSLLKPYLKYLGLDSMEILYVTTAAVSPPVAYGLIRIMIEKGYSTFHILGSMALGNASFSALRSWWNYLLPYYLGLYPPKIVIVILILQAGLPIMYNLIVGFLLIRL